MARALSDSPPTYEVAIVGLGPVGATAAIFFAHAGLKVVAFERDAEVYKLPRAVSFDGEIVRGFQRLGLGAEVAGLLQPLRPGERLGFANSKREWLFSNAPMAVGSNGYQSFNMFDQPELEGYLRRTALAAEKVKGHLGVEVTAVEDQGGTLAIAAKDLGSGEVFNCTARYLLGCDGAASFVRKEVIGSGWRDLGYDHDWLVVDITTKPGHQLDHRTMQVCDPERLSTYVCTKDPYRRWEFKLNPGETWDEMLAPERIQSLIDPWTPPGTYAIRRAAVYQFHAAVADSWRRGRVFIAGDAAHQTPPFLGQGMNAGMRDVINLAWKLPLVLSGLAEESLLASYQAEREAHAEDLVDWAVAIGQLMEHLAAVEAAQQRGEPPPEVPPKQQSSGYGQGREMPPLRDGVIMVEQVSDGGSTGYLFNQPIVSDGAGDAFRLDERLGPGFAVVARSSEDLRLSPESLAVLKRLEARCVSLDGLEVHQGRLDRLFERAAAAVIRPDRYVFGHVDERTTLDDLVHALAGKLRLRPAPGATSSA